MKIISYLLVIVIALSTLVFAGCSPQRTLTMDIIPANSGTVTPGGIFKNGVEVPLVATPADGWKFDNWSGDITGTSKEINITMNTDKSITANFSKITYNLTSTVNGNGTINPGVGVHTYDIGTTVSISATPASGWKFDGWSGAITATSANTEISMNKESAVTANFSKITYTLTLLVNGSGKISPASSTYDIGKVVNITATPADGWNFDKWSGDVSGNTAVMPITMDSNKVITAIFVKKPWEVLSVNTPYESSSGLTVTMNSIKIVEGSGYDSVTISYTLENLTSSDAIDEGSFKIYFQTGGGEPQYGFFSKLYPGDSLSRAYTWKVLHTTPSELVEYYADFFGASPAVGTLKWRARTN